MQLRMAALTLQGPHQGRWAWTLAAAGAGRTMQPSQTQQGWAGAGLRAAWPPWLPAAPDTHMHSRTKVKGALIMTA
jgi:hypothetical protein